MDYEKTLLTMAQDFTISQAKNKAVDKTYKVKIHDQ